MVRQDENAKGKGQEGDQAAQIEAQQSADKLQLKLQKLMERRKRGEEPETASPSEEVALLQEIRDLLRQRSV